jgi:hypothetical protein
VSRYEQLADAERKTRPAINLTPVWDQLQPIGSVNGTTRELLDAFCERKRITIAALGQLGARYAVRNGRACLAFAGTNGAGRVTAVKYRPLDGNSHDSTAEDRSVWQRPIVVGEPLALNWLVAEGETDAARLLELSGGVAAVLALPAGAATFKPEWARIIPRGATCWLAYDADEDGDKGAAKAARLLGGKTVRLRPPDDVNDWCEWPGGREEFAELLAAAGRNTAELEPLDLAELLAGPLPPTPWLWHGWLARGELALVVADPKVGKSLLALGLAAAVRRGQLFLGAECARGRVGFLDFENPLDEVQKRLRAFGISADDHEGIAYFHMPQLDLVSPEAEHLLGELIRRHQLDLLVIDSARRAAPRLDENDSQSVSAVFTPLRRVSAQTQTAIPVIHHARKRIGDNPTDAGQMVRGSGDLVASVDALFYLRAKESGSFTLETVSRRGLPHEPILVHVEADDDDETIALVNVGPVALAEDKLEATLARIVDALRAGPLERQVLALRVNASPKDGTFSRALNLGWQRGQLAKTNEQTRKSNEPLVYALAPEIQP